jgi:hypothetical protein
MAGTILIVDVQLDKADLDAPVTNEASEGLTLEYKESLPSGSRDDALAACLAASSSVT